MATIKDIIIRIRADATGLRSDMASAASTVQSAGRSMSRAGKSMTRNITLPVVAIGAASVHAAVDFENSFTKMESLAGVSRTEIQGLKRDVLELSGRTAIAPKELAEALYFIRSSGFAGADAIKVLDASARAARAGLGSTITVADAVTSAVNAYGQETLSAASATDILVAAVRQGKGEADAIGGSIGRVIPLASELGVSFADTAASISAMTLSGLDAAEATTAIRGIFTSMLKPTADGEKALKHMGLTTDELRASMGDKGLLQTLLDLKRRLGDNKEALADIFPNVRALAGFLNLTGKNAEKNINVFDKLNSSTGSLDTAFKRWDTSKGAVFAKMMNDLRVAGIKLGEQLIPILIHDIIPAFQRALDWWTQLSPASKNLTLWLIGLAAVAGPILRLAGAITTLVGSLLKLGGAGAAASAGGGAAAATGGGLAGKLVGGAKSLAAGTASKIATGATLAAGAYALGDISAVHMPDELTQINQGLATYRQLSKSASDQDKTTAAGLKQIAVNLGANADVYQLAAAGGMSYEDALNHVRAGLSATTPGLHDYLKVIHSANGVSDQQRRKILGLVSGYNMMAGPLRRIVATQVSNLLAMGDTRAAMALLRGEVDRVSHKFHPFAAELDRTADAERKGAINAVELQRKIDALHGKKVPVDVLDHASAKLAHIRDLVNGIARNVHIEVGVGQHGGIQFAHGGVFDVAAASGFAGMTQGVTNFTAGEGDYNTPYGKGAEWVQPMNTRGERQVVSMLGKALKETGGAGGGGRISGTLTIPGLGAGHIEGVIDAKLADGETVGRLHRRLEDAR